METGASAFGLQEAYKRERPQDLARPERRETDLEFGA